MLLDGKWMYQSSKDQRVYITTSNLYELQGLRHDTDGIPVEPPRGEFHPPEGLSTWTLGGLSAGWLIALGLGGYLLFKKK